MMLGWVVHLLVDPQDDREDIAFARRADDDLVGAGLQMQLGFLGLGEQAGRLDDDLDAEPGPRQIGRVFLGQHHDLIAIRHEAALARQDLARELPVRAVILEQVGHGRDVADVVDRDDIDRPVVALADGLVDLPADPPETVDPDLDCDHHTSLSVSWLKLMARLWPARVVVARMLLRGTVQPDAKQAVYSCAIVSPRVEVGVMLSSPDVELTALEGWLEVPWSRKVGHAERTSSRRHYVIAGRSAHPRSGR